MAVQIDELPDSPSRNDSRDVFSNKANLFAAAMPGFRSQANALAQEAEANALLAEAAVEATSVHVATAGAAAAAATEAAILAEAALTTRPIIQNVNAITEDQTIPAGHNALSVGPITTNDGVTVIVAPGSSWRIL